MITDKDVMHAFESGKPVPRSLVLDWLSSADLEVSGAAYAYLSKERYAKLVDPALSEEQWDEHSVKFLQRCAEAGHSGEWTHSSYEAAWALASWFKRTFRQNPTAPQLPQLRQWLEHMYRTRPDMKDVLTNGFLEHALEAKGAARFFGSWRADPQLTSALNEAQHWSSTGGNSPL